MSNFIKHRLEASTPFIQAMERIRETAHEDASAIALAVLKHFGSQAEPQDSDYNYYSVSGTDGAKISFWKAQKVEGLKEHAGKDVLEAPYCQTTRKRYGLHANTRKAISQIICDEFTEAQHEKFANAWKSLHKADGLTLKLYSDSDNIKRGYDSANYCEDDGTNSLWDSCMRYEDDRNGYRATRAANFYADRAEILILEDANGVVYGRALIWDDVNADGEPSTFIDRIYSSDALKPLFGAWAIDNGIDYRHHNDGQSVNLDELPTEAFIDIDLRDYSEELPYVDTFRYYSECELTASADGDSSYEYILDAYSSGLINGVNAIYNYRDRLILESTATYIQMYDRDGELRREGYADADDIIETHDGEQILKQHVRTIGGKRYSEFLLNYCEHFDCYTPEETTRGEIWRSSNGRTLSEYSEVTTRFLFTYGGVHYVNDEETRQAMQFQAQEQERQARKLRRALQAINRKTDAPSVDI